MLVLIGSEQGASLRVLTEVTGISSSSISRRCDAARLKVGKNREQKRLAERIRKRYLQLSEESQALRKIIVSILIS
jgi:hypothetical protein